MAHHKNNKPRKYKGCCAMCACQDHEGGLRNKRTLTLAEVSHIAVRRDELAEVWPVLLRAGVLVRSLDNEWDDDDDYDDDVPPLPQPSPLRVPLALAIRKAA